MCLLDSSNLLLEHVAADEIEHGDCADFQIVCPACREAVHLRKGEVRTPYLSHYKAIDEEARECELRVGAIPHEQIARTNALGREQTLALFQTQFRHAIIRAPIATAATRR